MRALAVLALLLTAHPARAEFPVAADLGVRAGYGIPFGNGSIFGHFSETTGGQVPFWLDAGVRLYRRGSAGLFVSLGPAFFRNCDGLSMCPGLEFRIGLQGSFHLLPRGRVDPWVGVGVGYEHLQEHQMFQGAKSDMGVDGLEVHVHLGCDYRISPHFGIGPFVDFTVGAFVRESETSNGSSFSNTLENGDLHEWLLLGVRFLWTS